MLRHFKMIPLLIIVAMLAFSVRLVEVASGVSTLSKAAIAAEEPPQEELVEPDAASAPMQMAENTIEEEPRMAGTTPSEEPMAEEEEPSSPWLDSGDGALEFSAVRMEMFEEVQKRDAMLDERERQLTTREALLRAAEQELERKYQELSAIRADLEQLLDQQSEAEKERVASLVKIYEGMKAKDAARIFDTLDLDVLVSVMSQMSERRLAPILAAMNPERARTITIMLAEQKKLPTLP